MSSQEKKPTQDGANQPASARASARDDDGLEPPTDAVRPPDDTESLERELDEDLTEPHIPLDGAPPQHWKHVDSPLTLDERLKFEAAKEEHQERVARGRRLGKL